MRRQFALWQLAAAFVGLLALVGSVSAQTPTPELYFRARNTPTGPLTKRQLEANSPRLAPRNRLPVLFVHGHNFFFSNDFNRNYKKNWQDRLGDLPSFMETLDLDDNAGLGIEDYYIRFRTQGRSIAEDAAEIGAAIELILHRHDPDYPDLRQTTNVQVVIIAYSKGTISTRLYLKNLEAEERAFRPISEFIAIAPPNHGANSESGGNTTAGQEMMNGYDATCTPFANQTLDFFTTLNGHTIEDTKFDSAHPAATPHDYPSEAPGSRSPTEPPTAGILYVTIFANNNRDFVGGDTIIGPENADCQGRRLALNLSSHAVNISVSAVSDESRNPLLPDGDPSVVHQNTVHTPEVICRALYAAAHHRAPPVDLNCGSGAVPVIPPPPRAAAMLTLDFSGSMALSTGPNATRASVLKEAVELFVNLWLAVSVPSDRIGVNYFRTNVEQFPSTGPALDWLSVRGEPLITNMRDAQEPRDKTALGNGLQRAIETLRDTAGDAQIRRVILFTDGMQNVNPMARIVDNRLNFVNESGRPNSNVSPTAPAFLDPSLGIAVDTIGIGASDLGLLQDVSATTDGLSRVTTDIELLRRFFVEELINALKGFSPQLVAYRRGSIGSAGKSSEAFAVEGGPHRVVLKLSWKRGDSMDFSVSKDGVDVTAAGRFIKGEFYKIFVIDVPKKGKIPIAALGNWQIQIKGKKATAYEAAAIVDGGGITYDAVFKAKRPKVGEPLDLVVRSTAGSKPIDASAKVTATLMIPTVTPRDLITANPPKEPPVFEPGMTLAERQLLALPQISKEWAKLRPKRQTVALKRSANGAFTTRLRPQVPGIYTAVVTIHGEAAKIGKFSRTMTVTTVVRSQKPTQPETNKP